MNNLKYKTRIEFLEYNKERQRKFQFGVPPGWYDAKLQKQNFCCAICNKHANNHKRGLHIDHNHTTGQIRDLLCHSCNIALGMVEEDVVILDKIKDYIIKWNNQPQQNLLF